jgi:beta-galactosidase
VRKHKELAESRVDCLRFPHILFQDGASRKEPALAGSPASMKKIRFLLPTLAFLALIASFTPLHAEDTHTFRVADGQFQLDGKPFRILSGEMHYPRIPRAYWRDRLRMAKAMGLNTVTVYAFWNDHEQQPGTYDFSGQHDVAEFVREAQQEGLYVILRPGPYVCAEWEFGGYPAWLLKDPTTVVRSSDPKFMDPAKRWLKHLGKELAPLQYGSGGPILAVQVENEYGSFGEDHAYMQQIRQALLDAGFTKAQLYTADGADVLAKGTLPDLPAVINFGPGSAKGDFEKLKKFRPEGPYMNGEYWAGWFDHWGDTHHATDAKQQADELAWILAQGYSISIYMFHGGTNFGWMNGANWDKNSYQPDVTSYDYDAPLDESGRPTEKYKLFREAIAKATGAELPPVPATAPTIAIAPTTLPLSTSLWQNLPQPVASPKPLTMEDVNQAYGYILYRTTIAAAARGDLVLDQLHDYAVVYANRQPIGTLDRRLGQDTLAVNLAAGTKLEILVENSGRINYSLELRGERKGITRKVTLAGKNLTGWQVFPLPMNKVEHYNYTSASCAGACFYRGTLEVAEPGDTFLDTSAFSKGFVWINGHPLGRIWSIGPQKALYLPGPWLHKGTNDVIVFDLDGASGRALAGRTTPMLDGKVH